jgi:hypothetical protein
MNFSDHAKAYQSQATQSCKQAADARDAYYTGAGAQKRPAVDSVAMAISNYQPLR